MKKKFNKNAGYSATLAEDYVEINDEFIVVSDVE